ncbi:MAG: CHASE domain-containing protein [Pseudomonadota bacterium]|nr:CHASE domain-containing protein [Pseudomonadota bacterium]
MPFNFRFHRVPVAAPTAHPPSRRAVWPLALGVLLLALAATFSAWHDARAQLLAFQQSEFDFSARQTVRRIEQRMATYEQVERSTQAFLLGSMEVSADDFRRFVLALRLNEHFRGIQGVALAKLLAPAELAGHVAAMRKVLPNYQVHPTGERAVYSSITHIEPLSGLNLRAPGFDMLSEPIRRAAMERARDTGQAAASGKVRLIQEDGKGEQAGLVMYLPVYRRGEPVATLEQRRASLIGWVGAPFRMDDLMEGLRPERSGDIILAIDDGPSVTESARLYRSDAPGGADARHVSAFSAVRHILVGGRAWTLTLRSAPLLEARVASDRPGFIALIGSIASVLLALLVWTLASGRGQALALAGAAIGQLRDSEFRWKYALEGAGDGVWDWDRPRDAIVYSRRWKQMLGYDDGDIAERISEWQRLIHPHDRAGVAVILADYLAGTEGNYEAEFRMRCKDGSWRWILARGMAVTRDSAGQPVRMIGTHTDISRSREDADSLRHANAQLAAEQRRVQVILDHTHDAFVAVAHDGRVTDWNAKAHAMFGWSAAEAVGSDLANLIVPADARAAHNAGFRRFVASGAPTLSRNVFELTALHRSGRLIPVELAIAGFPAAGGHAVSAFIRDISERTRAQALEAERSRALDEARTALHHAQKLESVGKLTGGIAHDFNNVLHIIGGNVQLLQLMSGHDERTRKRLVSMQNAVDRGAKLSSQLLAFARRQPLQPVAVNPRRVLRNMDDLLQRALGESVVIDIVVQPELWNTLADPGQLENVILNLVINARDAMPDGGVLTIDLRNTTLRADQAHAWGDLEPGQYVRLAISDSGVGMEADVMAQAFEPFFTTKPVGQGTGLGLSMAYGFVKQSGGHIHIESVAGHGTTVVIHLPRTDAPDEEVAPAAPVAVGGTETILVVEDDAEVKATAVGILRQLGYHVLDAHDGASALLVLGSGVPIDVLFTDVVMPGPVSSTELAARARQLQPSIAVLFTSGYTQNALITGGRLDEGVQLLGKPYHREQLARKVRDVLIGQVA